MNNIVISITKFSTVALLALSVVACEAEKSRNPLSPNVAGPIAGVSLSVPTPATPVDGAEVLNTQPVRLTFNNSSSNGERPFWYIVELASDAGFTNRLYANGRVSPGTGTQTSVVVDGTLPAERTYYWRVKADDGANASEYSAAARFDLVMPVVWAEWTTGSRSRWIRRSRKSSCSSPWSGVGARRPAPRCPSCQGARYFSGAPSVSTAL
jgi:hypothetical protein